MTPYRRIQRIKQFIMDRYVFNLDLDTWGLTDKETELERFRDYIDPESLKQSNALFGYEGDKYYFDIDIRTHFGLDKYAGGVIPYWKTETVEAMDAFRHKPDYSTGAGECVSLSTLYTAALFVVGQIPLGNIYLMATPLHSQNFIDIGEGILTNNRRLVTKKMWFNGMPVSAKARRALENERVTVVAHESGHIHTLYPEATIAPAAYGHFMKKLRAFLRIDLTPETFGSFVRFRRDLQSCFQLRWNLRGSDHYIGLEHLFGSEIESPFLLTDSTRKRLLDLIDMEDSHTSPIPGKIVFNEIEDFVGKERIDLDNPKDVKNLLDHFPPGCLNASKVIEGLLRFCGTEPRLPVSSEKRFTGAGRPLEIKPGMPREDIIKRMESIRAHNLTADLAFYAFRDLTRTDPQPFLTAALKRSPVSLKGTDALSLEEAVSLLRGFPEESIYDGNGRLAQPDEVWNYRRGDGLEKLILLANIIHRRWPDGRIKILIDKNSARLESDGKEWQFPTSKRIEPRSWELF
ncbi:MAG TPA: hypothetical protein VJC03_08265, partial [bacterium]|nr:hypothetical protein [bacterium]